MSRYWSPVDVVKSSLSLIVASHSASQMSLVASSSGREMAFAGDVARVRAVARATAPEAMRSTMAERPARVSATDGRGCWCVCADACASGMGRGGCAV